jgi:hypothetical protein
MARIRVFAAGADPAHDQHLYGVNQAEAFRMVQSRQAVRLNKRAIKLTQILTAISAAVLSAAGYDASVNRAPATSIPASHAQLMFGQMWEARKSDGFRVMQLCPPMRRPDIPTVEAL